MNRNLSHLAVLGKRNGKGSGTISRCWDLKGKWVSAVILATSSSNLDELVEHLSMQYWCWFEELGVFPATPVGATLYFPSSAHLHGSCPVLQPAPGWSPTGPGL